MSSRPRPFPHWLSWILDNPVRSLLVSPARLLAHVTISPTDRILEVGPGSGFFSVELASRVPRGHLELLDLQPEMLAKARRKVDAAGFRNVGFTVADAGAAIPVPPASFDLAVLVAVLGEIANPSAGARGLAAAVKPGGRLLIHEHIPDPDLVPLAKMRGIVEPAGFSLESVHGPDWNFTAVFVRTTGPEVPSGV